MAYSSYCSRISLLRLTIALFGAFQPPQSLIHVFEGTRDRRRDQANRHECAIAKYDSQIRWVSEKAHVKKMIDRATNTESEKEISKEVDGRRWIPD